MHGIAPGPRLDHPRRLAACPSQEELAERAGLHWTYMSQVERGRRNVSVDALGRLGTALGVPAWRLLRDADEATE